MLDLSADGQWSNTPSMLDLFQQAIVYAFIYLLNYKDVKQALRNHIPYIVNNSNLT